MHGSGDTKLSMVVLSITATAICWGVYGPLLQWGHQAMGSGRLRPFICVGVAYLVVAIVGPVLAILLTGMEREAGLATGWTMRGVWWSIIAGTAGALGALGMILAFNFGGKPHYVPPLIFGFAPVVNTLFTLYTNPLLRAQLSQSPFRSSCFGAGLLMVAVGAVTVLISAPKGPGKPAVQPETASTKPDKEATQRDAESARPDLEARVESAPPESEPPIREQSV